MIPRFKRHCYAEGAVLLILLFTSLVRLRLLRFPLERDEGEYAYAGQLLLDGILPYKLVYSSQKLPGVYGAYALIMSMFGQTAAAIHLGLLIVNLTSSVLVFLLAKRLYGSLAGVVACASFAIFSLGQSVLGMAGHATHFVMLPALGGVLLLLRKPSSDPISVWRLYFSGLLLGLAFVMRQPALAFVLFGLLCVWRNEFQQPEVSWRNLARGSGIYLAGAVLPFALICAVLGAAGLFQRFWYWTFIYVFQYASEITPALGLQLFLHTSGNIVRANPGLWIFAGAGLLFIVLDKHHRSSLFFTAGFLITSFLTICPGLYFREHYFVQILPVAAILAGTAVNSLTEFAALSRLPLRRLPVCFFMAALAFSLFQQRKYLFELSPLQACRVTYGANPFPESVEIAKYLKARTTEKDQIAVIGSEAQIYFYAHRRSATGYIFTYALMEPRPVALTMQREMISEIEASSPRYIVAVNVSTSWLQRANSNRMIFEWLGTYLDSHYQIAGIADIISENLTEYRWDTDAVGYRPKSPYYVSVWKNNDSKP